MLAGESCGIDPVTGEGIAQAIEYGVLAGSFLAGLVPPTGAVLPAVDGWQEHVARSRLARDLRIRTWFLRFFYGPARPRIERFMTELPDAIHVGCQHFAAAPQDPWKLAQVVALSGAGLLVETLAEALHGRN